MAQDASPTRVGRSSDFEPGAISLVEVNGREIGIVRLRSGELRAVLNYCPHKGAPICKGFIGGVWESSGPGDLSFDSSQEMLVCPWHGFEFSLDSGRELCWNKRSRLRFYPVHEAEGDVFVSA